MNPPLHVSSSRSLAANGRRSYCIDRAKPNFTGKAELMICEHFGFRRKGKPVILPSTGEGFVTLRRGWRVEISVGWDNGDGFNVLSESAASDGIVGEIADYLDSIKDDPHWLEYFEVY